MPTQTKRRQKQGQDETRHPPQKSIMQNTDVKQTENQPYLFQRHSIRKFSFPQKKKKTQLNCSDTRVITKNRENVCMQTTQLICQAHLCGEQKTITLQELDQLRKGHKPTNSLKKKINFHHNQK